MRRTLETARARGDAEAERAILDLAPYPDSGPFTIEKADAWRKWANRYGSLAALRPDADFYFNSTRLSPLYTPEDRENWARGSLFTVTALWPRLADVSFSDLHHLDVPVILLLGRHDTTTPSVLARDWLERLTAPHRSYCWFENSGHLPMIEEPGRTLAALLAIRPLAEDAPGRATLAYPAPAACSVLPAAP